MPMLRPGNLARTVPDRRPVQCRVRPRKITRDLSAYKRKRVAKSREQRYEASKQARVSCYTLVEGCGKSVSFEVTPDSEQNKRGSSATIRSFSKSSLSLCITRGRQRWSSATKSAQAAWRTIYPGLPNLPNVDHRSETQRWCNGGGEP